MEGMSGFIYVGKERIQKVKERYAWIYIPRIVLENLKLKYHDELSVYFNPKTKEIILRQEGDKVEEGNIHS